MCAGKVQNGVVSTREGPQVASAVTDTSAHQSKF